MKIMAPPSSAYAAVLLPLVLACSTETRATRASWQAETDTVGDTVVVRTIAGSTFGGPVDLVPEISIGTLEGQDYEMLGSISGLAVDDAGNIYVYDSQVPALRKYGPDGAYIATFGRKGEGPGEYQQSDGGVAILRDGRIVLRDPGNARFTLWQPDGTFDTTWVGRGGFFTSTPLFVDTAGYIYPMVFSNPPKGSGPTSGTLWITRLVRMRPDGTAVDTIGPPQYDFVTPSIIAERKTDSGTNRSQNTVPFAPSFQWTFSPHGYFVAGVSSRYAVDLHRTDGSVLRIAREVEPVSVPAAEKADAEARVVVNMKRVDPDWRWNGPPIPDVKPAYRSISAGTDGRIWVRQSVPSSEVKWTEEEQLAAREQPDRPPPPRYREPVVFDVFEPDGRYVGEVRAPKGFSLNPQPVFGRDRVWAVFRDSLEVNYVVRYRIGGT
jgi:hypothetical protein